MRQVPSHAIQCTKCRKLNLRSCFVPFGNYQVLCFSLALQWKSRSRNSVIENPVKGMWPQGFSLGQSHTFIFASRIKLCIKLLWQDISLMDIGLIINKDSLSQLPHERLVSTCLPVLLPATGVFVPSEMQEVSVRSTELRGQSEPCRKFPIVLFSVQSLLFPVLKG